MVISILAVPLLYARNEDLYGVFTFFLDTCKLFVPLVMFGMGTTVLKFFPEIKKKKGNSSLLVLSGVGVIFITVSVLTITGLIFRDQLAGFYSEKSKLVDVGRLLWILIPLGLFYCLQIFIMSMISNYRRIAFPKFIHDAWRLSSAILFALVLFDKITVQESLSLMVVHFGITSSALFYYCHRLDPIQVVAFREIKAFLSRKDVQSYSLYAILVSMGSSLAFNIDSIMITSMLDTSNTGVYTIANRIGSVVSVPTMAILAISTPIISKAMMDKKFGEIHKLYRRSSEILTVAGACLLAGLASVAEDLFKVMPNGDAYVADGAFYIIALIAVARLIDMMTSVNSQIISLSEHYRYNLLFLGILALMNVILNFFLIDRMGIRGAAWASFFSLVGYNVLKVLFIRHKLNMWPFTYRNIVILIQAVLATVVTHYVFSFVSWQPLVLIFLKGSFVVFVLAGALLLTRISSDFNDTFYAAIRRVRAMF